MKNAVGLSPLSVIVAVFVGGAILGVIGAVIAIPIAAAVQVLVVNLLRSRAIGTEMTLATTSTHRGERTADDRAQMTPGT